MSKANNAKNESLMKTAKLPHVFQLELTPPKPVINPDVPLTVTLKNVTEHKQEFLVETNSFLFELVKPRAKVWPIYQIYHLLNPGETTSFQIKAIKETPEEVDPGKYKETDNYNMACRRLRRMEKPEGHLIILHAITEKRGDTDGDWGFEESPGLDYYLLPGRRIAYVYEDSKNEYGSVGLELSCEKETELIKKRKEEFNKMRMEEKLEEEKRKKKEKACCSCTVL